MAQKLAQPDPISTVYLPAQYIPHTPSPKQRLFLWLPTLEAFYGGAAGGGKSDALLMGALMWVHVPRYAALLLRQSYADLSLPGALMSRAQEWLGGTDAKWRDRDKTWTFPSGATLTFGYLETEKDRYRYQSTEFQFIGWDELTQFSEIQYRYLFSRLRRLEGATIPLRMRSASNPGGAGHDWVKQWFLEEGKAKGRIFIRATLWDNPFIDKEAYIKSLDRLDPVTRQQLLDGDWGVRPEGGLFKRHWFPIVEAAPADIRWVRFWDMAATEAKPGKDPDWTAGMKLGLTPDGRYYIADVRRLRATPGNVERAIAQTAALDGRQVTIWMEQEPGSSGVNTIDTYRRRVLQGFTFHGIRSTGSKVERVSPISSQAEAGNVMLVAGSWIGDFLDELEQFPMGGHDDQVDALSGAATVVRRGSLTMGFAE